MRKTAGYTNWDHKEMKTS